jgi:hypothetical protein
MPQTVATTSRVEREAGRGPDREHRFTQGDQHDQALSFRKVARVEVEFLSPEEERGRPVDQDREDPDRRAGTSIEPTGDDQEGRADQEPRGELQNRLQIAVFVVAGVPHVEDQLHGADEEVGAAEENSPVAEGLRDAEGDDQHASHGREHADPVDVLVRVDAVREPSVNAPGPPDGRQDQQPLAPTSSDGAPS